MKKLHANIIKINFFLSVLLLILSVSLKGQDARFSQYSVSPIIIDPSTTGMYSDKNFRATAQYRMQWNSLSSKYTTSAISFDMPLNERWGVGGYILNSDAVNVFNVFNFVISGAYQIMSPKNGKHSLSMGLQLGLIYKNVNDERLVFDNQYVDGTFDPDLPSGENITNRSKVLPEAVCGFSYASIDDRKSFKPYVGMSLFHLTMPKESFVATEGMRLPIRYVAYGGTKIKFNEQFIIDPSILFMLQKNAIDFNFGFNATYYLGFSQEYAIGGGARMRLHDAIIPMLSLGYKNIFFQVSYDYNISTLKEFSNGRGGVEVSIVFVDKSNKKRYNPYRRRR